jgi:hypothetical protein
LVLKRNSFGTSASAFVEIIVKGRRDLLARAKADKTKMTFDFLSQCLVLSLAQVESDGMESTKHKQIRLA